MELSMKKFTVRRFFSVYLRKKSRSKSSSLSRLEEAVVIIKDSVLLNKQSKAIVRVEEFSGMISAYRQLWGPVLLRSFFLVILFVDKFSLIKGVELNMRVLANAMDSECSGFGRWRDGPASTALAMGILGRECDSQYIDTL
ncbi:hypothetical protein STEG23_037859 [Scotinomys teguina]